MKTLVHIRKEHLKFSAAHMTVFPNGTKEALHGHNYQVELSIELKNSDFKEMVSFSEFKNSLKKLTGKWDEKVLLAEKNPFFKVKSQKGKEIQFSLCGKNYLLPSDEVELLPIENISSEALAQYLLELWIKNAGEKLLRKISYSVSLRVDESPGQGASVIQDFRSPKVL